VDQVGHLHDETHGEELGCWKACSGHLVRLTEMEAMISVA